MLKSFRTKVLQAAMGHRKPHAAPELITTFFFFYERSDPGVASDQAAILLAQRLTQRDPRVSGTMQEVVKVWGGDAGENEEGTRAGRWVDAYCGNYTEENGGGLDIEKRKQADAVRH